MHENISCHAIFYEHFVIFEYFIIVFNVQIKLVILFVPSHLSSLFCGESLHDVAMLKMLIYETSNTNDIILLLPCGEESSKPSLF